MSAIKVVVNGATGKMGQETIRAICNEDDISLVGATCHADRGDTLITPRGSEIPLSNDLSALLKNTQPDVIVDFTNASVSMEAVNIAKDYSTHMVIGASGLTDDNLKQIDTISKSKEFGVIVAPNFALGAVILKKLAEEAAPYFDYLDIVECHHEAKIDAPSGFAMNLAQGLSNKKQFTRNITEKENLPNTRGGEYHGITIHSMRMPGKVAQHEVVMGAAGQTLTIRHDTLGRDCYMPGVILCIRKVVNQKGLMLGLENVLAL
ncbi:MAG: 4-hydroxy-tetrahydrodipicolinate reductase [Chloroflexota bacterium]|nr:4-hydroxy-tetrahydrodipicolinate reductase [Chloroflexota bacterium]